MNLIVAKQLLKFGAGEKVEVALAPCGAPSFALPRCGEHFFVGVREMDDEFGDARFEMLESVFVEIVPVCGRNARLHGDNSVDHDVVWAETLFEKRKISKPAARDQDWEMIFVADAQDDFEEIFVRLEKTILVGIEVRGFYTHGESAGDLRAEFGFDVPGIDASFGRPIVMKVAVGVDKGWHFVARSDGSPAIVDALAGERKMEAEVCGRMGLCVVGNFGKPRTRNHEACGVNAAGFESMKGSGVDGVGHAEIVGVDDKELCIAGIAEFFL